MNTSFSPANISIGSTVAALVAPGIEIIARVIKIEKDKVLVRNVRDDIEETILSLCEPAPLELFFEERHNAKVLKF